MEVKPMTVAEWEECVRRNLAGEPGGFFTDQETMLKIGVAIRQLEKLTIGV